MKCGGVGLSGGALHGVGRVVVEGGVLQPEDAILQLQRRHRVPHNPHASRVLSLG